MKQQLTLGEFEGRELKQALSRAHVELPALTMIAHWRRCGLTADWLASMMAYDFEDREQATGVLSTVVNELLENAVKYCSGGDNAVSVSVAHFGDELLIEATNMADERRVRALYAHFSRLEAEGADKLFEELAVRSDRAADAGVGLIILQRDYGVAIAAQAEDLGESGLWKVRIQAMLPAEEMTHA